MPDRRRCACDRHPRGRGLGLSGEADIVIGTFSKALGGFGGYVASTETVRDYLVNRCGGVIYSTALPPPVLGAIDAALDLVPGLDAERAHVASLAQRFRAGASAIGLNTGASTTQIVPIILGSPEAALAMSGAPPPGWPMGHVDQAAHGTARHGAAQTGLHRSAP